MKGSSRNWIGRALAAACAAALCLALLPLCAAAGQEERQVLRVGFPIQAGFTERTEDGAFTGYTYEYLEEIAQYTGWDYEFVVLEGDLNEALVRMLEMLRDGELDLLGAMNYSDALAELYDYPGASYGTANTVIAVPEDNAQITQSNFQRLGGLRIAVPEGAATRLLELERFCSSNNMSPEIVYCAEASIEAFVRRGEADAMVCMDVGLEDGFRVVAKFSPRPYYFATTKGNADIVSKLNTAILKIGEADPYLSARLYEKYFGAKRSGQGVRLSEEEAAFVKQQGAIRVAYVANKIPLQFQNREEEFSGIARDVFDYIAGQTGLSFTYVASGQDELVRMLEAGEVDLLAGIPYDYELARRYNVALTQPYLSSQIVMVVNRRVNVGDLAGKRLVLPKNLPYQGEPVSELTYLDTVEACVDAVERGDADFTYGNGYTMRYYAGQSKYRNVTAIPRSGESQQVAVGVGKPVDVTLMTILNKAVGGLPDSDMQTIIYHNINNTGPISLAQVLERNPMLLVGAVSVLAALIILGTLVYARTRSRFGRRLADENERYRQLCELSNEHLFEYDYATDRMLLTEQCARYFGVEPVQERYRQRLFAEEGTEEQAAGRALFQRLQETRGGVGELECTMPGGERRWFRVTAKLLLDRGGQPLRAVGKLTDIQSEKARRDELEQRAQRDSLTGLYNAAACRRLVEQKLLEEPSSGALMILDIDLFKQVNDQYGHFTGDNVLKAVTTLLEENFRREDVVGRPGGDEFLVYLSGVQDAQVVEEKCRTLLAGSLRLGEAKGSCEVTLSIGAAMAGGDPDYDALYRRADRALYRAKANGRDGFVLCVAGAQDARESGR